jgi:hypothetical protein
MIRPARNMGGVAPLNPVQGWSQLPGRTPAGTPPHPQGTQHKGAEENDDANEQQVQQALGGDAHNAQHDRYDHQKQKQGNH